MFFDKDECSETYMASSPVSFSVAFLEPNGFDNETKETRECGIKTVTDRADEMRVR